MNRLFEFVRLGGLTLSSPMSKTPSEYIATT